MPLPTTEQARDGGIAACLNAGQLVNCAVLLAGQEYFGQAVALAVLAFEEAAKGRALLGLVAVARTPGARYGFTDEQLRTLIYGPRHGFRHAAGLWQLLGPATLTALATRVDPDGADDKVSYEADLTAGEWLQQANKLKQAGLYVDFHEDHWHVPNELKGADWELARRVVEPFVSEAIRQATGNILNKAAGRL